MIVGFDFDNTLIDYGNIFREVGIEKNIIPDSIPNNKLSVRNYLREINKENEWTILQGEVYGKYIMKAKPFLNCIEALSFLSTKNVEMFIISHKTRFPFLGKKINLHKSAYSWLEKNNFLGKDKFLFEERNIFFEESIEKKIERIKEIKCDIFVDDLPEILDLLPRDIVKILFSSNSNHKKTSKYLIMDNWSKFGQILNNYG